MFCKSCGTKMNDNQIVCLSCGCSAGTGSEFCANCGGKLNPNSVACLNCGVASSFGAAQIQGKDSNVSDKDWLITLLICLFVGGLGIHRFYVGKTGTGILWLFTLGCFGIGSIIDLIMILCGKFTDADGKEIKHGK